MVAFRPPPFSGTNLSAVGVFVPQTYDAAAGLGVNDATTAIQSAWDAAAVHGGELYFPPGTYRKPSTSPALVPRSNVMVRGAGESSVLYHDSTSDAGTSSLIESVVANPGPSNWSISDIVLQGSRGPGHYSILPSGPQTIFVKFSDGITLKNVHIRDTRYMAIALGNCDNVLVDGCNITKTNADGVRAVDTPNLRVVNCRFRFVNDDCIAAHTTDASTVPLRSGVVISNNTMEDSQGVSVLGAKSLTISGNVMRRMMSYGLHIGHDATEGNTAAHSVIIVNNTIQDVFLRQEVPPRNGQQTYLLWDGSPRAGTTAVLAPGMNNVATGVIVPPFGPVNTPGSMFDTSLTNQPGAYNVIIANNIFTRTLPAVATWSQWGYGAGLEVGDIGVFNGAIPESALNTRTITLLPYLRNALITGNVCVTTGDAAILFGTNPAGEVDLQFDDVLIEHNMLADFSANGIYQQSGTATFQNVTVRYNKFDGDPRFVHANRGANGTWAAAGNPICIWASSAKGWAVEYNDIRNVCQVVGSSALLTFRIQRGNILRCDPLVAPGFSVTNKGIGNVPLGGQAFLHHIEGSDPQAADFRTTKNACLTEAAAQPSAGTYVRGHVCYNNTPVIAAGKVTLGWVRATTGAAHVAGTDWNALVVPNA